VSGARTRIGRLRWAKAETELSRWLRRRPWEGAELPDDVRSFPSMLYEPERALLFWLGRRFRAQGAIVDAGCFLGGSTYALAAGLAAGGRGPRASERLIHSYDLFRLDALTQAQYPRLTAGLEPGDSLRPSYERLLGPHLNRVEVHEGDIREMRWSGGPIEILFLDLCKTWELNDHVLREFFPALIPHRSVVIQQDYVHEWLPHIPVSMGLLADALQQVAFVPPSSVLYVPTRPIAREEIPSSLRTGLTDAAKLELFDCACRRFSGEAKAVLECSRAMLLLELGRHAEAAHALNAVDGEISDRVASAAEETRSWLLRSDPDPAVALPAWERWHRASGA
jgi:hypothetical protein